jgi:Tfp pilus assembly protein PilV
MSRRQFGFSLIEVMISALLLMVIALGVLPMFLQAAASNEIGREYMEVSNFAKSRAEEYAQNAFNSPALTITSGTQLVASEYYSAKTRIWRPGTSATATSAGDLAMWVRTTTVRQFSISDLATPLAAGAPPETIHLKEITVDVQGVKLGNIPGSGKQATVRMMRSQ